MIQCSPTLLKALLSLECREVIITCPRARKCEAGMLQCSPKLLEACFLLELREAIIIDIFVIM